MVGSSGRGSAVNSSGKWSSVVGSSGRGSAANSRSGGQW